VNLLTCFPGRNSQILASFCCHAGIEFFQGNVLKIEKECKFLHGPNNSDAELLVCFTASIKFKKSHLPAAKSRNILSPGELSSAIVGERAPILAPWFSAVSTSASNSRLLVTNHRISVSTVVLMCLCDVLPHSPCIPFFA
jgi:hypothetical protein